TAIRGGRRRRLATVGGAAVAVGEVAVTCDERADAGAARRRRVRHLAGVALRRERVVAPARRRDALALFVAIVEEAAGVVQAAAGVADAVADGVALVRVGHVGAVVAVIAP